jgi:hypothetical protein
MTKYQWTPAKIKFLRKHYPAKGSEICAVKFKFPPYTIRHKANKLKISANSSAIHIKRLSKIKTKVDADQFINIKSPEAAYLLGLIWADGYIHKKGRVSFIRVAMVSKDLDLLSDIFLKTGEWNIKKVKSRQKYYRPQTIITTNNRLLVDFLIKNGYQAKSNISACSILSKIPEHLHQYWFRGCFDGDGCAYIVPATQKINRTNNVFIASSFNQDWKYLIKLSEKLKIKYHIYKSKNKYRAGSRWTICSLDSCLKFLRFIYSDNLRIALPRKLNKYKLLKSTI